MTGDMVQPNPDIASSSQPDETPCKLGETGPTQQSAREMHKTRESPSRPALGNLVWRTYGARPSTSSGLTGAEDDNDMAVEAPILRHSFDPWSRPRQEKDRQDGECKGCAKISLARARAATAAAATTVVAHGPLTLDQSQSPNSTATMPTTQTRDLDDGCPDAAPDQLHELNHNGSVLAIAVSDQYIFVGTNKGEIAVWSLGTYQLVQTIQAHKRSLLCLHLTPDNKYLLSSASEPIINVWCPRTFTRLYEIYTTHDAGDVFSVVYSPTRDMVYIGTQTQDIQWVCLSDPTRKSSNESPNHPDKRQHRFFDSSAVGGTSTPRRIEDHHALIPQANEVLEIHPGACFSYAHYGWIFGLQLAKGPTVRVDPDEEVLISAGGDGVVKLWKLKDQGPEYDPEIKGDIEELMELGEDDAHSVMSLAVDGSFLYAGKKEGIIELWDLDTTQKLRVIKAHDGNVNTLGMGFGLLWSAAAGGSASKHSTVHYGRDAGGVAENVSQQYQCLSRWKAHDAKVISSAFATHNSDQLFLTGANDNRVRVWRVNGMPTEVEKSVAALSEDMMISSLREFVSYKTVSSRPEFTEDCRKGANFLASLFKRLGAQVEMLSTDRPHNPVVFAKFSGKLEPAEERKRILFYGHYDVVPADTKDSVWKADPFKLSGLDGYLYGRGVSDNKGPIIAALYAVADLLQAKRLDSDLVFLIEGEEESGSRGFEDIIRQHKGSIGHIDYILLANSYWLDDEVPCLTYGLRGVLHATVCIDSPNPDLHSGVDGSNLIAEATSDLTLLLAQLKDKKNRVLLPGFYDGILPLTEEEELHYDDVANMLIRRNPAQGSVEAIKRSLMAKWREPNLTFHRYHVSGPEGSLISKHATANVSMRLVPGQEVDKIVNSLRSFLEKEYAEFDTQNTLTIRIENRAEPWLGVPGSYIFKTLEDAVMEAWGPTPLQANGEPSTSENNASGPQVDSTDNTSSEPKARSRKPLYIREGGSIPSIRFLEKEFDAPAANLPCGQASDAGHLPNERLRVENLLKSRDIFNKVFQRL